MALTPEQRDDLRETFDDIDTDKNGTLSKSEVKSVLNLFSRRKPSPRHLDNIFQAADADGDGVISFDEFVAGMDKVHLSQEEELKIQFEAFDSDGDGVIEPKEFEQACTKLHIVLTRTDVEVLLDEFDENHDKKIDFEEFKALVRSYE
jgi:calcium-dependent protein kinase